MSIRNLSKGTCGVLYFGVRTLLLGAASLHERIFERIHANHLQSPARGQYFTWVISNTKRPRRSEGLKPFMKVRHKVNHPHDISNESSTVFTKILLSMWSPSMHPHKSFPGLLSSLAEGYPCSYNVSFRSLYNRTWPLSTSSIAAL